MSRSPEYYTTKSGEHTLYLEDLDETYHSRDGAISESNHVFINTGLVKFLDLTQSQSIRIFEMGFGTGLNALLTALYAADHDLNIHYHSIELFPLDEEIWSQLNYDTHIQHDLVNELYQKIHNSAWGHRVEISPSFTLHKEHISLHDIQLKKSFYNVVFFDAFAPQKQPDLWSEEVFRMIYSGLSSNAVLTTYSAAGQLKRNLRAAGFQLNHPQGANGKREMTQAIKIT